MSDVTIRRMTIADVQDVWSIENATFPTPWSLRDFEHEMQLDFWAYGDVLCLWFSTK